MEAKSRLCKRKNKGSRAQNNKKDKYCQCRATKNTVLVHSLIIAGLFGILFVTDHTYIFSTRSENEL